MSAPNTETASAPHVVTGGAFGTIVANSPAETLGFYGATGVAKQSVTGVTTVAALLVILENLGLVSA